MSPNSHSVFSPVQKNLYFVEYVGKTTLPLLLKTGWGSEPLPQWLLPIIPSPPGVLCNTLSCPNQSPNRTQQRCLVTQTTALGARSSQEPLVIPFPFPRAGEKQRGEGGAQKNQSKKLALPGFWVRVKSKNLGAASCNTLQAPQGSPHGTAIHLHSHLEGAWLTRVFCQGKEHRALCVLRRHALRFTAHLARLLHKKGDGVLVALLPEHGVEIFFSTHAMEEFFSSFI